MGKDFVLEAGRPLNARLNIFPDTHLLRRVGDPDDAGDEADLDLQVEFEEEGGEEERRRAARRRRRRSATVGWWRTSSMTTCRRACARRWS